MPISIEAVVVAAAVVVVVAVVVAVFLLVILLLCLRFLRLFRLLLLLLLRSYSYCYFYFWCFCFCYFYFYLSFFYFYYLFSSSFLLLHMLLLSLLLSFLLQLLLLRLLVARKWPNDIKAIQESLLANAIVWWRCELEMRYRLLTHINATLKLVDASEANDVETETTRPMAHGPHFQQRTQVVKVELSGEIIAIVEYHLGIGSKVQMLSTLHVLASLAEAKLGTFRPHTSIESPTWRQSEKLSENLGLCSFLWPKYGTNTKVLGREPLIFDRLRPCGERWDGKKRKLKWANQEETKRW